MIPVLVTVAGIASRVYVWSDARPLWVDEEMVLLNVRDRTFAQLADALWLGQSAPLGWLGLQRAVMLAFGMADRTGRAIPVLFGIATIIVALWAGRRWIGPVGATILVLLFAFGQHVTFFIFEAKHYSADVFGALLLSALAIWAIETAEDRSSPNMRRVAVWWLIAAIGQWFGNGALFVTPGCALVLFGVTWRRAGAKRAAQVALMGLVWVAAFALHYQLALRHALQSEHLQGYWVSAFPPAPGDIGSTLRWLAQQFEPLAINPGGTPWWVLFWLVAVCGIAIAVFTRPPEGLVLLAGLASAFVLAALRLVPLSGRLSLWITPALYGGIAIAADSAFRFSRQALAQRDWKRLVLGATVAASALALCFNIYQLGRADLFGQPRSKHGLDDRLAVRFLMSQRQPGDVLLTTHLALPAVWWYAGVSLAGPNLGRTYEPDGGPILEAWHEQQEAVCRLNTFRTALAGASRVAVYLGFDSDTPAGFQELMLDSLSELGAMTSYRGVAERGRAAIFDLRLPPKRWAVTFTSPSGRPQEVIRPPGCVGLRPASRW